MNSVIVVNWEDKDFAQRLLYSLERAGYLRSEDYECGQSHMQVWQKAPEDNLRGRVIGSDPLAPVRLLPQELMVQALIPRLVTLMPEGTPQWQLEWAATNLVFDLMGKPG